VDTVVVTKKMQMAGPVKALPGRDERDNKCKWKSYSCLHLFTQVSNAVCLGPVL